MTTATTTLPSDEHADTPGEEHPSENTDSRGSGQAELGIGMIALLVAISVVSGTIGAVAYDRFRSPPPRIMVLDMPALVQPIASDPSLNEYQRRQITEDLGRALEAAMTEEVEVHGNIVLDASAILRAPEDSYVQP